MQLVESLVARALLDGLDGCSEASDAAELLHAKTLLQALLPRGVLAECPPGLAAADVGHALARAVGRRLPSSQNVIPLVLPGAEPTSPPPGTGEEGDGSVCFWRPCSRSRHSHAALASYFEALPWLQTTHTQIIRARARGASLLLLASDVDALSELPPPAPDGEDAPLSSAERYFCYLEAACCPDCYAVAEDDAAPVVLSAARRPVAAALVLLVSFLALLPGHGKLVAGRPGAPQPLQLRVPLPLEVDIAQPNGEAASPSALLASCIPHLLTCSRGEEEAADEQAAASESELVRRLPAAPVTIDLCLRLVAAGQRQEEQAERSDAAQAPPLLLPAPSSPWGRSLSPWCAPALSLLWERVAAPLRAVAFPSLTHPTPELSLLAAVMARMGTRPPSGVLLDGPPGTGKTALAKALAAASGATLLVIQCGQLLSKYVGDSEANIRRVFATARRLSPCVLVLDEVDVVGGARAGFDATPGGKRSGGQASSSVLDRVLSTLLNEMDGVGQRKAEGGGSGGGADSGAQLHEEGEAGTGGGSSRGAPSSSSSFPLVVVVGTCVDRRRLDPALLRPGRLSLHVSLPLPDAFQRQQLLSHFLRGKPLAQDVDLGAVAARTEGATPADLEGLASRAALRALQDAVAAAAAGGDAAALAAATVTAAHLEDGLTQV